MSARNPAAEAVQALGQGDLDRARALAGEALAADPESPKLHHLMGLIACRGGDLASGSAWLRRAAEAEPANAAFRVMLVRALVDSGQARDALDAAIAPTGTSPADLALWHARAEAAGQAGEHAVAAEAWGRLAAARPGDWRALSNQGNALAALGQWDAAAKALGAAAALNPAEAPITRNLASALLGCGRGVEAETALARLVAAEPGDALLRLHRAQILYELERHEDSLAEFDEAARLASAGGASGLVALAVKDDGETDLDLLRRLALLLERTGRFAELGALLDEAETSGTGRERLAFPAAAAALHGKDPAEAKRLLLLEAPDTRSVRWHRLMARIEDSLGDPASAFAEATAMNRAVDDFAGWRERGAVYRERVRGLSSTVTADWAARIAAIPPTKRRSPAFLVGFPRSGTTLLDTFLMGHPGTRVLEEVHLLGAAELVLGDMTALPERSAAELEAGRDSYFALLDEHVDPDFAGLVVDKLPLNMLGLPFIRAMFPDARIIFAQRHPADAVLSGFMQAFVLNDAMASFLDIADAAELYDAAMAAFTAARGAIQLDVHTLVYEALVADPEAALRPLVAFLGLDWRAELLDHRATAKARGAVLTPSYDQVTEPLSKAPSGRWRRYAEQLRPALPLLLPWAKRLGYPD